MTIPAWLPELSWWIRRAAPDPRATTRPSPTPTEIDGESVAPETITSRSPVQDKCLDRGCTRECGRVSTNLRDPAVRRLSADQLDLSSARFDQPGGYQHLSKRGSCPPEYSVREGVAGANRTWTAVRPVMQ